MLQGFTPTVEIVTLFDRMFSDSFHTSSIKLSLQVGVWVGAILSRAGTLPLLRHWLTLAWDVVLISHAGLSCGASAESSHI